MTTLYVETSIVSYLRQRPSSQVVMAARQLLTHQWWDEERGSYELVTSQYVLMSRAILPPKASIDALHIAIVAHHRIQYLLTWNCKHIANAKILPRIHEVLTDLGIPIPIICTPEEMVDDDS